MSTLKARYSVVAIPTDWTPEKIILLTTLWNEKTDDGGNAHSSAQIGALVGVGKNAVIGKARRLNLDARESPIGNYKMPKADQKHRLWRVWFRNLSAATREKLESSEHLSECAKAIDAPMWECTCGMTLKGTRLVISVIPVRDRAGAPIQAPHKPAERVKVVRPPATPPRVYHRPIGAPKTCQYPTNDGARMQWTFCDDPTLFRASSYCQAHHGVCYGGGR